MTTFRKLLPYLLFAIISFLLFEVSAKAQTSQVRVQPDCIVNFFFNTASQSQQYNNLNNGQQCLNWTVSYSSTGFSALSLVVQTAPDSSGAPGSWSTFAAVSGTGSNPNTATTSASTQFTGYFPWVRAFLTSKTGSGLITGILYGYRTSASGGSGGGGGATSNVNVAQWNGHTADECGVNGCPAVGGTSATGAAPTGNPVYVGGRDGAGNLLAPVYCTLTATFDTSTSGNTLLVAAVASKVVKVCRWTLTPFTAGDSPTVSLVQGTGATCAGGTATLDGAYENVVALSMDYAFGSLTTVAANALCLNLGSATRVTGSVSYAQFVL